MDIRGRAFGPASGDARRCDREYVAAAAFAVVGAWIPASGCKPSNAFRKPIEVFFPNGGRCCETPCADGVCAISSRLCDRSRFNACLAGMPLLFTQ
jgi:hypothetical protein